MALIECIECSNQVSNKADICPQCGIKITDILEKINKRNAYGWVYILSHEKYDDLKIGFTTRTVELRIKDLERGSGVMPGFVNQYAVKCKFPKKVERRVHKMLSEYRVSKNREFFSIDVKTAASSIHEVCDLLSDEILEVHDEQEVQRVAEENAKLAAEKKRQKEQQDRELFEWAKEQKLKLQEKRREADKLRRKELDQFELKANKILNSYHSAAKGNSQIYNLCHLFLGFTVLSLFGESNEEIPKLWGWVAISYVGAWFLIETLNDKSKKEYNTKISILAKEYKANIPLKYKNPRRI